MMPQWLRVLLDSIAGDWKLARRMAHHERRVTTDSHPGLVQRMDDDTYRLTFISNQDESTYVALTMNHAATVDLIQKLLEVMEP